MLIADLEFSPFESRSQAVWIPHFQSPGLKSSEVLNMPAFIVQQADQIEANKINLTKSSNPDEVFH